LVGGGSVIDDEKTLSKSGGHILIATPGRLLDLMEQHAASGLLQGVKELVNYLNRVYICL
jgi:superfamily II DNA/RNA helicase